MAAAQPSHEHHHHHHRHHSHSNISFVLLDIEGTTTPISFVADELFPYIRRVLPAFLEQHFDKAAVQSLIDGLRRLSEEDQANKAAGCVVLAPKSAPRAEVIASVIKNVYWQMDADRKSSPLKALQGYMWKDGYASGELRGKVYPDVVKALQAWKEKGVPAGIYSSGSIDAQKLLFGFSDHGDLLPLLSYHFDLTTAGSKLEAASYEKIAAALKAKPETVLFVSDAHGEVVAARKAGFATRIAIRPGNKPLPTEEDNPPFVKIHSFEELLEPASGLAYAPSKP